MGYHFAVIDAAPGSWWKFWSGIPSQDFDEVWPLRHYPYDALKRKVLTIIEEPDLSQSPSGMLFKRSSDRWKPATISSPESNSS